jgi:CheY-like chemotaxis protein
LAERLRAAKPGLKVIYSSGYSRDTLATEGASPANDFHLPKPYQPAALTQTVRRCLDTANS